MGIGQIIAIIIAIPTFILIVIPMVIQFWAKGQITDVLMQAFGVNPIIAILISVCSLIAFLFVIFNLAKASFLS